MAACDAVPACGQVGGVRHPARCGGERGRWRRRSSARAWRSRSRARKQPSGAWVAAEARRQALWAVLSRRRRGRFGRKADAEPSDPRSTMLDLIEPAEALQAFERLPIRRAGGADLQAAGSGLDAEAIGVRLSMTWERRSWCGTRCCTWKMRSWARSRRGEADPGAAGRPRDRRAWTFRCHGGGPPHRGSAPVTRKPTSTGSGRRRWTQSRARTPIVRTAEPVPPAPPGTLDRLAEAVFAPELELHARLDRRGGHRERDDARAIGRVGCPCGR